jgi:hypothetical protein
MCLINLVVEKPLTNKVRVYKTVSFAELERNKKGKKCLVSAYRYNHQWKPGVHISNREEILGKEFRNSPTYNELEHTDCDYGFHIFTSRKVATRVAKKYGDFIIALTAYTKDYVCSGDYSGDKCVVYSRLTVEKREYQRTMSKVKKTNRSRNKGKI